MSATLANPEQRIADLERHLAEREAELAECKTELSGCKTERNEALQRETATSEVLQGHQFLARRACPGVRRDAGKGDAPL